jgi:hypothetical protein
LQVGGAGRMSAVHSAPPPLHGGGGTFNPLAEVLVSRVRFLQ